MEGAKEKRRGGNSEREGREGEKAEKGRATTERDREEREGKGRDQRPPTEQSTLSEASESLRRQKEDRKREKERKKAEKKAKKKSKHSLQGAAPGSSSKQRERVGGGEAHRAGSKELEAILLSVFQPYDPDGSGYVDSTVFWQVGDLLPVLLSKKGEPFLLLFSFHINVFTPILFSVFHVMHSSSSFPSSFFSAFSLMLLSPFYPSFSPPSQPLLLHLPFPLSLPLFLSLSPSLSPSLPPSLPPSLSLSLSLSLSPSLAKVIQSSELNLQFSAQELSSLQEVVPADRSGLIPYAEFATHATDIIASLYQDQPPSDVRCSAREKLRIVYIVESNLL